MNKRMKKKYKPIRELWDYLGFLHSRIRLNRQRLSLLEKQFDGLKGIESTNTQPINKKFEECDKQIDLLKQEIKQLKQSKKKSWFGK